MVHKGLLMLKFLITGAAVGGTLGMMGTALVAKHTQRSIVAEWRSIPVTPPEGVPPIAQNSIELALAIYGIEVPSTATHPVLNKDLDDRGLSSRYAWADKIKVEIGPAAFESWSLLASTLAHELEVHCLQNFALIGIMDFFNLDGTARAERQAYMHELKNAQRFGLTLDSQELIASTMNYYYDMEASNRGPLAARMSQTLGRWLALDIYRSTP